MTSLSHLPTELIALILTHLPVIDLIRCQQVSLLLRALVKTNANLQYKISLALACMEDAQTSTRPSREKLKELCSFQRLWTRNSKFEAQVVNSVVPYNDHMNLAQDTMVQGLGMRTLKFTRLSCELTKEPEKAWEVNLDFDIIEFAFDPDEGLLIAIEAKDNKCYVRFLDMNTGKGHKDASKDSVYMGEFGFEQENQMPLDADILVLEMWSCRNTVLILANWMSAEREVFRLVTWDWHTGAKLLELQPGLPGMGEHFICSVSCLTPELVLLGLIEGSPGSQKAFIKAVDLTLGAEAYSQAFTFEFPPLNSNMADLGIWRNVPTTPSRRSVHHNYLPFQCTQEDAAISFGLFLDRAEFENQGEFHFVIPTSKFLQCIEKAKLSDSRTIKWRGWIPHNCRLFEVNGAWDVAGCRSLCQNDRHLQVMNFSQSAVRFYQSFPDGSLTLVDDESEVAGPYWKHPIRTTLPYLAHEIPLPDETEYDMMYCGSDTIFLCNEQTTMCLRPQYQQNSLSARVV
ncbi:hypothetical protein QCA50_004925 [Cerrena zonata]|uniref:F-box domain-containing protein n=1 Tax=Cerrena zonata TaxID=2478898 RepID=A0AAW0GFL7_9APHY